MDKTMLNFCPYVKPSNYLELPTSLGEHSVAGVPGYKHYPYIT